MIWETMLAKLGLTQLLKLSEEYVKGEVKLENEAKDASWELYVELTTRITTQKLEHGDEQTALTSVYSLFETTRLLLKKYGRKSQQFSKIAIVILNQKIRPFTAKWHKESQNGAFEDATKCKQFRNELEEIQRILNIYAHLLAELSGIEDLTDDLIQG